MAETKIHTVRIPDELWVRATARAHGEGTNLSALIRIWLQEYVISDGADIHDEIYHIMFRLQRLASRLKK